MSYRNDVDALAARTDALAAEVATKTQELDATRALLDEVKARAKLPVLPNIRVASPCKADWNAMTGDERVRACAACSKNVYNVSSLTRDEAEALIVEKEGKLCVRYYQRKDGTILLKDCSIGITQKRRRRVLAAGVAALLGGGVIAAITLPKDSRSTAANLKMPPSFDGLEPDHTVVQGGVSMPEPTIEMGQVAIDHEVMMGDIAGPEDTTVTK